jgi:hypothetical protein
MPVSEDQIDELTAAAFGLAAYQLQNAMLTFLVSKGQITVREAALIVAGAVHQIDELRPTPLGRELVELARQSLKTLRDRWKKQAEGN